jgi:hypothetical protein
VILDLLLEVFEKQVPFVRGGRHFGVPFHRGGKVLQGAWRRRGAAAKSFVIPTVRDVYSTKVANTFFNRCG